MVLIEIHSTHRMINLPTNNQHEECYACWACTCHKRGELMKPCEGKFR